jgi:peptide deformylase
MNIEDIVLVENPEYHLPSAKVTDINEVRKYVPAMMGHCIKTGTHSLCAKDIGLDASLFVVAIPTDWPRVFINPEIEKKGEDTACLALNLKGEQFIVDTSKGAFKYYRDMAKAMSAALRKEGEHVI